MTKSIRLGHHHGGMAVVNVQEDVPIITADPLLNLDVVERIW